MALAVVIGVGFWQATTNGSKTPVLTGGGAAAAAFHLPDISNPTRMITLGQFAGHSLVINFWASWCIPCRTEMPVLEAAARHYHSTVKFVGININDTKGDAQAFMAQAGVTYPVAFDPKGTTSGPYGLIGLPTTVFVNASGVVVGVHDGGFTAGTLGSALRKAFGTQ
ncbi:MAG: TlpA family protein disulfide reductase [Acidimicrobiales bacterium]